MLPTPNSAVPRARRRFAALSVATALLAAPLAAGVAAPALADPVTDSGATQAAEPTLHTAAAGGYADAEAGDLLDVRIGDVHPTQPSIGYDEIYYKLGRYDATLGKDAVNKRFGDWCEANGQLDAVAAEPTATLSDPASFTCELPLGSETDKSRAAMKTVVIGPEGVPYLTDGHHTLTSLAETPDGGLDLHVRLRVVANLSDQAPEQFWQTMIANKWTWLEQVDGSAITPDQLPAAVGMKNFADDPNRSLLYFARDIGFASGTIPFQEFYWGAWLRDSNPAYLASWNRSDRESYLATVRALSEQQVALPKDGVVYSDFTAADLGALAEWNDGKKENKGEWDKLSQPYEAAKPGKLAYAMAYKATLPETEEPGTEEPGTEEPGTEEPGTEEPGTEEPGTEQPTDPATVLGTLSVQGELVPGGTISVNGSGFAPSTSGFSLELHSDPVKLADVTTDADGAFTMAATLPESLSGAHRVVLLINGVEVGGTAVEIAPAPGEQANGAVNANGTDLTTGTASVDATIAASGSASGAGTGTSAALAQTGAASALPALALGGTLLLVGATALVLRRRAAQR